MRFKSITVTRRGGPEVLEIIKNDLGALSAGKARIRVLATCLDVSQDGRIVIGSCSGYACVYDQSLKDIFKDIVQKSKIVQLMFSVDGKQLLSIGNDRSLWRTYL
jgi:WD40 repeat protein